MCSIRASQTIWENTAGAKCSGTVSNGHFSLGPYTVATMQAVLVASGVPGAIQDVVTDKSHLWHRTRLSEEPCISNCFYPTVHMGRVPPPQDPFF